MYEALLPDHQTEVSRKDAKAQRLKTSESPRKKADLTEDHKDGFLNRRCKDRIFLQKVTKATKVNTVETMFGVTQFL